MQCLVGFSAYADTFSGYTAKIRIFFSYISPSAPSQVCHQAHPPSLDPTSEPTHPLLSSFLNISTPSQVHLQTRPLLSESTSVAMASAGGIDELDGGSTPIRLEDLSQSELAEMIKVCKAIHISPTANAHLQLEPATRDLRTAGGASCAPKYSNCINNCGI